MKTFILFLSFFFTLSSFAQTQKEVQKMMEDAKKMIAGEDEMDPAMKDALLKMMNSKEVKEGIQNAGSETIRTSITLASIPEPDTKRLAGIPASPLNKAQLASLIQDMATKTESQISAEDKNNVKAIVAKAKGSSIYLSSEAVYAWYNEHPGKALLLAIRAAALPGNSNALNNLGAMLNIYGYEEKAVPLLQYARKDDPTNSSVLNNLGRAWLGLGEKKKAEEIYLACVQLAPGHPEANNALGCLYEAAGDPKKAAEHFEKSLDGAYNEAAARHLEKLSPGFNIVFHISKHHKVPEYFNQFKFQVPEECFNGEDYFRVKALHEAFQKSISDLQKQYDAIRQPLEIKGHKEVENTQQRILASIEKREVPDISVSPFVAVAARMLMQLSYNFKDDKDRFIRDYEKDMQALEEKYRQALAQTRKKFESEYVFGTQGEFTGCLNYEEVNKRMCPALKQVSNNYQEAAASVHRGFVDKYRLMITGYCDEFVYWNSLNGAPKPLSDAQFYTYIHDFLAEISYLSKTTPFIAGPERCDGSSPDKVTAESEKYKADKKPGCPVNINIPFIVGKLSLDCSSFSISGGEGVTAGYKKDFMTGQSTISIGAGLTMEIGGAGMGVSAGASENIYVTFDKNGNPTDTGFKFDAGGKIKMGSVSTGTGAGYTMGMNSGWDFTANAGGNTVHL